MPVAKGAQHGDGVTYPRSGKVKAGGERIFGYLKGMGVSAMIYLGDKLGLYQALDGAGLVTSAQIAQKTGLHERWVREWIRGQAAAGIIDYKGDDRFELSPEIAAFLADCNSPRLAVGIFSDLPQRMAVVERLPQAFNTGIGLNYDARGPAGARGIERVFGNWYRFNLVSCQRRLNSDPPGRQFWSEPPKLDS